MCFALGMISMLGVFVGLIIFVATMNADDPQLQATSRFGIAYMSAFGLLSVSCQIYACAKKQYKCQQCKRDMVFMGCGGRDQQ